MLVSLFGGGGCGRIRARRGSVVVLRSGDDGAGSGGVARVVVALQVVPEA